MYCIACVYIIHIICNICITYMHMYELQKPFLCQFASQKRIKSVESFDFVPFRPSFKHLKLFICWIPKIWIIYFTNTKFYTFTVGIISTINKMYIMATIHEINVSIWFVHYKRFKSSRDFPVFFFSGKWKELSHKQRSEFANI